MTNRQAIVGGAVLLALLMLVRKQELIVGGEGVIDLRRSDAPAGSGTSSPSGCTCADPKPGIYVECGCDDPAAIATNTGYEVMQ